MRIKRLTEMFMIRLTPRDKQRLEHTAEQLGLNAAELTRLSLRAGLPLIRRKLPATELPAGDRA